MLQSRESLVEDDMAGQRIEKVAGESHTKWYTCQHAIQNSASYSFLEWVLRIFILPADQPLHCKLEDNAYQQGKTLSLQTHLHTYQIMYATTTFVSLVSINIGLS